MTQQEKLDHLLLALFTKKFDGKYYDIQEIFKDYPNVNREESYQIAKRLEGRSLINVLATKDGTSAAITGDGVDYVEKNLTQEKAVAESIPSKVGSVLNAISKLKNDERYFNEGLTNKGLLGYVLSQNEPNTAELISLRLSNGKDFFYTTDLSREKLDKRNPINEGTIGWVYVKPQLQTVPLMRFYNPVTGDHLFITKPNLKILKAKGYRDETNDNPIYIYETPPESAIPIFLYSNLKGNLFENKHKPTEPNFELEIKQRRIQDLWNIIENSSADKSLFQIPVFTIDNSITIFLETTPNNFYINPTEDNNFFLRENPVITYPYRTVNSWEIVLISFSNWLIAVLKLFEKGTPGTEIKEEVKYALNRNLYKTNAISIRDTHEIEPVLGVTELATQVVSIIKNLKSEPGNMSGIFGPWGRGKTFLMNQIWKLLSIDQTGSRYIRVNYQAWRYQDTPASWAYLYERFLDSYLGDKRKNLKNFIKYYFNLWKLNFEKEGYLNLLFGFLLFFLAITSFALIEPLKGLFTSILQRLGATLVGFLLYLIYKNIKLDYLTKAFNLIKKYGIKPSFKENLGAQAEIQKELIHLILAWTKENKTKIVLFVDDLDRCKEEKTIEIIDSLRIILDDEKIKDKLIVIAAIDERMLQMAVRKKYEIGRDKNYSDDIIREYIDKLFIFSLKLGPLSNKDSLEYFAKLIKNDIQQSSQAPKSENIIKETESDRNEIEQQTIDNEENNVESKPKNVDAIQYIEKLSVEEVDLLKNHLSLIKRATPRRIRIIYYRYLLAKNILINKYSNVSENCYWLKEVNHDSFIKLLILFSQNDSVLIVNERERVQAGVDASIQVHWINRDDVPRQEYTNLLDTLELVIAY